MRTPPSGFALKVGRAVRRRWRGGVVFTEKHLCHSASVKAVRSPKGAILVQP